MHLQTRVPVQMTINTVLVEFNSSISIFHSMLYQDGASTTSPYRLFTQNRYFPAMDMVLRHALMKNMVVSLTEQAVCKKILA
jgi:hypothetical protein